MSSYEKSKDKEIFKQGKNPTGNRWFNVGVYSYDGGPNKARIMPAGLNKKAEEGASNRWINQKAITGLTVEEIDSLVILLQKAKSVMK